MPLRHPESDWSAYEKGGQLLLSAPNRKALQHALLEGLPIDTTGYERVAISIGDRPPTDITQLLPRGLIMTSPLTIPSIEISDFTLTPALLPTIRRWMDNPDIQGGVVRLRDERQIILTGACHVRISGSTVKQATQRRREDFWYLEDLLRIRQKSVQVGGSFEETWHSILPPEGKPGIWKQFTNKYTLVYCDLTKEYYQVGEKVAIEEVPAIA